MLIHELNQAECAEFLSRNSVGRLGCALFNQPYIVPIHFSFDADRTCLYAFSMIGQKIEWMRKNPRVCVEVDEIAGKDQWTTVLVFGRYHELERSPKDAEARNARNGCFRHARNGGFRLLEKCPHPNIMRCSSTESKSSE